MKGRRKIKYPHLVGSKWTAAAKIMGWRHFQVFAREDRKGLVFARLQSVCAVEVNFWVNAKTLKNRDLWEPGWTTLGEMAADPDGAARIQ
ncbi:TIGR02450 family Trp-rich protein [Gloeobacter morelensis]|uniref:TIGR02450 family Trp-rich protein n=1 Tax=Gloeobacter morelensis MG652769 TaxID=2781736 RepID=A0ABY3PG98_9CYAN|nr:TIGR02450 family Trp-rich protein [Gloeobacter morelensis]UFP92674.1 TIGR02450 family Trp-rich protein [Gloeobacter morelensis MG652769]